MAMSSSSSHDRSRAIPDFRTRPPAPKEADLTSASWHIYDQGEAATDQTETRRLLKGKGRAFDDDFQEEAFDEDEVSQEVEMGTEILATAEAETRAIEENLKRWSQAERKKRATARVHDSPIGPMNVSVSGITRRSSVLLQRAATMTKHSRSRDGTGSQSLPRPTDGLQRLNSNDETLEMEPIVETTERPSIPTWATLPVMEEEKMEPGDSESNIVSASRQTNDDRRETKTGSRFIEDLDSQDQLGKAPDLSTSPVSPVSAKRPTSVMSTASSGIRSLFSPNRSPVKASARANLDDAFDAQSVASEATSPTARWSTVYGSMGGDNTIYSDVDQASMRQLVSIRNTPVARPVQNPFRNSSPPTRLGTFERYRDSESLHSSNGSNGSYEAPYATRIAKMSWLEYFCCLGCMSEDHGGEQGGRTGPELPVY